MAVLPGSPYNYAEPGCLYLVPVVGSISTQTNFFAVHVSHHMVVKKLIAGADYVKGTHLNPALRKTHYWGVRGKYKHKTHNTSRARHYKNLLLLQESLNQKAPAAAPAPAAAEIWRPFNDI
jgi:hypothetical protein